MPEDENNGTVPGGGLASGFARRAARVRTDGRAAGGAFGGSHCALLSRVSDMVTVSGPDGRVIYANPATRGVTGFSPEEFAALDPFETIHPDDRARCEEAFRRLRDTPGLRLEIEHRFRHRDGTWRWARGTFESLFDDPGVGGLVATVRDVTEEKRAEEALRESEEKYRSRAAEMSAVLESIGDAVYIGGMEGIALANRPALDQLGFSTFEELDRHIGTLAEEIRTRDADTGEPIPVERQAFARALGGERVVQDVRVRHRSSGEELVVRCAASPVVVDGSVVAAVAVNTDITDRKRAEEALRESEQRLAVIFSRAAAGLSEISLDGRFLRVNDGLCGILGRSREEVLASGMQELTHPEHVEESLRAFGRVVETGEMVSLDKRYLRPDGEAVWANSALTRLDDDRGRPRAVLAVTVDLTERKRAEEERERLRARELTAQAEAAERERISRELHDRVAHSMGVAHQALELHAALSDRAPKRAEEKLALARETTRRALDQTRSLAAELKRLQEGELEDGMEAALRAVAETAVPDGVEVGVSVEGDEARVPKRVAVQAYLVVREAVRNAVKHSGCSRVRMRLAVGDDEVVGVVEDDGEGFDPEAVKKASPSWGMGLRSMRERAEMLDGSLRVDSRPGRGTRVEVAVPLYGTR